MRRTKMQVHFDGWSVHPQSISFSLPGARYVPPGSACQPFLQETDRVCGQVTVGTRTPRTLRFEAKRLDLHIRQKRTRAGIVERIRCWFSHVRWLALVVCLLALPAWATENSPVEIQPDETFPWACDFHAPMASVISSAATVKRGTDSTPNTLLTSVQVDPLRPAFVTWTLTPTGKADGTVYQIHIVAQDAVGSKYACDGKVTIKVVKIVL